MGDRSQTARTEANGFPRHLCWGHRLISPRSAWPRSESAAYRHLTLTLNYP